jgi:hypothetical protein
MIVVDSSVWVDYFNGVITRQSDFLDDVLGVEPIATGDLIIVEVLQGFRSYAGYHKVRSLLLDLPAYEMIGVERAVRAAEYHRRLRARGISIRKTIDTLIATFCIDRKLPLLFSDRDFEPFVQQFDLRPALPAA